MSEFLVSYPDFFPCPTWQFSQSYTGFNRRTPYECGWTRQRLNWPEYNSRINMTFEMPTTMFDNWASWIESNGHEWFYIYLWNHRDEQARFVVRLTGQIQYSYDTYDSVTVIVPAETRLSGTPLLASQQELMP